MTENQIKIRPALTNMKIGQTISFPIKQLKSVRTQASELGVIMDRQYSTKSNREERTILVTRTN